MICNRKVSVVGLGYVGLPVAAAFGRHGPVVAFDISERRVKELKRGVDRTGELSGPELAEADLRLTTDPAELAAADFHIVTVPTPIDRNRRPDLGPLLSASRTIGRVLKPGDIVVYESTVYPGATEEDCVPVLEAESGLRCGRDFTVGYSPERINPGDRNHRFAQITKVVSGSDPKTSSIVAAVYGAVVEAGIHEAPTIRVAESAKVIENTQRDLNIALVNELAKIFHQLGIDTHDVLRAAATKWNFLNFTPGLVGGHCIGVDPYYLTDRAQRAGYHPDIILSGRRINDGMGEFIANAVVRHLLRNRVGEAVVTVLGVTFKEDVPDVRNTKVVDIVRALQGFDLDVQVHDPLADADEVRHEYGIEIVPVEALRPADAVVLAVPHRAFRVAGWTAATAHLRHGRGFVADVKSILDRAGTPDGVELWRL